MTEEEIRSELDIDFHDRYGIKDTRIYSNRDKIPNIQDCPRCRTKVALIDLDGFKDPDYYNMDSSPHFCITKCCGCGVDICYLNPESTLALNYDHLWTVGEGYTDHKCPYSRNALGSLVR